jgi:hypothetical protein
VGKSGVLCEINLMRNLQSSLLRTTYIESSVENTVKRIAGLKNDFSALLVKLIAADAPSWQPFPLQQQL